MDRYEVMAGKMAPLTDGAYRKWGFTGKVETRSYERLVDALIDFVETGDGLKARFLTGLVISVSLFCKSVAEAKEWKRKFGERNWDYLYRVLIALVAIATSGYAIFILFEMR